MDGPPSNELDALYIHSPRSNARDNGTTSQQAASDRTSTSFRSLSVSPPPSFMSIEDGLTGIKDTPDNHKPNVHAKDYPSLNLSGRIISVTFCLPYNTTFVHNELNPWSTAPRGGSTALSDSFALLSSNDSTWKHTHVGWTGELDQRRSNSTITPDEAAVESRPPISKSSAPVPVGGGPINPQLDPKLKISRADRKKLEHELSTIGDVKMVPVWLHDGRMDDDSTFVFEDQQKWRYFSEHELYQVFHYQIPEPGAGRFRVTAWDDYVRMNKAFADSVLGIYRPGDIVMVHNYQLMLLPAMLRGRIADIKCSFYLHIPFPSYEHFKCLAPRNDLINGIIGADMIAFQTMAFADHFKACCQRLTLGLRASVGGVETDHRHIDIQVAPIGINVDKFHKAVFESAAVDKKMLSIAAIFKDKKIIIGRDRLDPTGGIFQKLQAFAMLLVRYPEWREKIVLIQISNSNSIENRERGSEKHAREVAKLVGAINGQFGSFSYIPVRHYISYLPPEEYHALLRLADLGLVTSVRDGVNVTSLEFIVAQREKQSPLILSEFSGSSSSLSAAIRINPWDLGGTAKAIHEALLMTDPDREEMYQSLTPKLEANTVQNWTEKLLRRMLVHMEHSNATEDRPQLDSKVLYDYFRSAGKRLLVFDYDGTLTPIVEDPAAALPSALLLEALADLTSDHRNTVWIVSGRDRDFLQKHFGNICGLGLSAEHGSFLKYPRTGDWKNLAAMENMSWQPLVYDIFKSISAGLTGSVVERKRVSITWHYRRADQKVAGNTARSLRRRIQRELATKYSIEVMAGKANLEVRPIAINKGKVVERLVRELRSEAGTTPDFVLCLGDDTTDEDMFRSLRRSELPMTNIFGVIIGHGPRTTLASWRLNEPADVVDLLVNLNRITKSEHATPEATRLSSPTRDDADRGALKAQVGPR